MPIRCYGSVRYRFRRTKKGKQRLAFCDGKVAEVCTYKDKKKKCKRV